MKKKDLALDLLEMALARKDEPVALATALIALDRLTAQRPDHTLAHYAAGRVLMLLGKHQLALGAFRVAIGCDPDLYDAHYFEGVCHWLLGFDELALDKLADAFRRDKTRFEPWYDAGQIHANRGAHRDALACFERAQALVPEDFGVKKKVLQCEIRLGLWERARQTHAALRELWARSSDPEIQALRSYVLDQFELDDRDVLVLESFVPVGDPQVLMSFVVTEGGELVFTVNLESSSALRAAGYAWILVVQEGDVRVNTDIRYYERPGYPVLKADVDVLLRRWGR